MNFSLSAKPNITVPSAKNINDKVIVNAIKVYIPSFVGGIGLFCHKFKLPRKISL